MQLDILGLQSPDAPTLVLASGLGGVAGFWQPQRAALTARYRVVLYDQRGTGRCGDTLPEGYSMAMMGGGAGAARYPAFQPDRPRAGRAGRIATGAGLPGSDRTDRGD